MATKVSLSKISQRRLDRSVMSSQVSKIVSRMAAAGRGSVWTVTPGSIAHKANWNGVSDSHFYMVTLTIDRTGRDAAEEVKARQIEDMLDIGQAAGNSSGWTFQGRKRADMVTASPATFAETRKASETPKSPEPEASGRSYAGVGPRTDRADFFSHIYERDAQIEVVHSALRAFVDSSYTNRFHCVLHGAPACGKTEILRSFSKMLGADAVLELDATSTTKAGAERILLESAELPPVMICEEIEKTDEASLRWLLGILDHRGEIRKVTHGGGLRSRNVKMLCLATVNDMGLFRRVMDGALASRFSHKIHCPRPSKDVLRKILAREIAKVNGRFEWIDPAIDYCVDVEGTNDPRRVSTVCLSGRDALLSGEYQILLDAVREPRE